jgi:SAM-dependent methyltransferase
VTEESLLARHFRNCPACGSDTNEEVYRQRFVLPEGHPLSGGYTVVCCRRCGMVFAADVPRREAYDQYYELLSKYSSPTIASSSGVQLWDRERLLEMAQLISGFCNPSETHVVDIGCGSGGSLLAYHQTGFCRVTGVDPSDTCVESAAALTADLAHIAVVRGSLNELPVVTRNADLWVLSHVLEHVPDVQHALESLRNSADGRTMVYVEVPDAQAFVDHIASPFLEFNAEHINYFTEITLGRAVRQAGWVVHQTGRRVIKNGAETMYPVAWVVAVHDGEASSIPEPEDRDVEGLAALRQYVATSINGLERANAGLRRVVERHQELIVWGVGQTTGILLANTVLGTARIACFVDGDARYWGKTLAGVRIESPAHLSMYPRIPIVIASTLSAAAIRRSIQELSLSNLVVELGDLIS